MGRHSWVPPQSRSYSVFNELKPQVLIQKSPAKLTGLSLLLRAGYGREFEMVLKVLPILGPSNRMTAITTMATSARMIAYSTRPWPFSFGANNMVVIPFCNKKFDSPEDTLRPVYSITSSRKISSPQIAFTFASLQILKISNNIFSYVTLWK